MAFTQRSIFICQAGSTGQAVTAMKIYFPGENQFTIGLNVTGSSAFPYTYYWCDWGLNPDQQNNLLTATSGLLSSSALRNFDGNTMSPSTALAIMNLNKVAKPDTLG